MIRNAKKVKIPEVETDIKCELCGRNMVIKQGRFGKFLACPGYPECKNAKPLVQSIDIPCPNCGGKVLVKKTKKKKRCKNFEFNFFHIFLLFWIKFFCRLNFYKMNRRFRKP